MEKPNNTNSTKTPFSGNKVLIEYPLPVLETYDAIEKLLVEKEGQPLYEANTVVSDTLLFILNNLYQKQPVQ